MKLMNKNRKTLFTIFYECGFEYKKIVKHIPLSKKRLKLLLKELKNETI